MAMLVVALLPRLLVTQDPYRHRQPIRGWHQLGREWQLLPTAHRQLVRHCQRLPRSSHQLLRDCQQQLLSAHLQLLRPIQQHLLCSAHQKLL